MGCEYDFSEKEGLKSYPLYNGVPLRLAVIFTRNLQPLDFAM